MVFSSIGFIFLFLPVVLGIYYLTPDKLKNSILLLVSLFFYTLGEDKLVLILLATTVIDFSCGIIIEGGRRKLGLLISILSNLSFLAFFKYANFTFENLNHVLDLLGVHSAFLRNAPHIILPAGISFFTFQTLSYTIDVYRGEVKASRNILDFATYATMFPQLIAGPIVRYADIEHELLKKDISVSNFAAGTERFIIGLAKKILIANTFAIIADSIFSRDIADISTSYAWIGIISYSIQIYYDFSGYSDMAIGLAKMFGFDIRENFNYPYISKSIQEFWRRWHISLSSWFRDYLYIPLGGNREGRIRTYINLLIVFFLMGLWHGASWNFICFGLFHGFFIVIERAGLNKLLKSTPGIVQHIYALLVVLTGWVFFRADSLGEALLYIKTMFVYSAGDPELASYLSFFHVNPESLFFFTIAVIFSMPIFHMVQEKLMQTKLYWIKTLCLLSLFLISIIYMNASAYNPFIYFRF